LKKVNVILVDKLQVLLLLEADYNASSKIIFNIRIIPTLEARDSILHKIVGGRRSQLAIHIAINKKLMADIAN